MRSGTKENLFIANSLYTHFVAVIEKININQFILGQQRYISLARATPISKFVC